MNSINLKINIQINFNPSEEMHTTSVPNTNTNVPSTTSTTIKFATTNFTAITISCNNKNQEVKIKIN
jgi:hypothetical protein